MGPMDVMQEFEQKLLESTALVISVLEFAPKHSFPNECPTYLTKKFLGC